MNSFVEYYVMLEKASVTGVEELEGGLIGRNAKAVEDKGNRRSVKSNVKDYYSEVIL